MTLIGLAMANPADAETVAPAVEATCTSLTVTAPPGTRLIIGLDAQPGYRLTDGATGTFEFYKLFGPTSEHVYFIDVRDLVTDEQLKVITGAVQCQIAQPPSTSRAASRAVPRRSAVRRSLAILSPRFGPR